MFRRIEQIGHDAVHVTRLRRRYNAAEIIDFKFEIRAQPDGETLCQLYVVSGQIPSYIIGIRLNSSCCRHGECDLRIFDLGDIRHSLIFVDHPAPIHVIQCSVLFQFLYECIDFALNVGNLRFA